MKCSKQVCVTFNHHKVSNWQLGVGLSSKGSPGGLGTVQKSVVCCSTRGVFPGVLVVDDLGKEMLHIFCCGIRSAVIATISSARSDSTAHHTSCSITPSQLSNASRRESLASVFLTQMCHETAVRVSDTRLAAAVLVFGNWASQVAAGDGLREV